MIAPLKAVFLRDLRLAVRIGGGAMVGVVFFLAVVTIVPFGVGPDMNLLARIGPAILWIGALLATLLGLDRLFQADADDGSLDLMLMAPAPLPLVIAAKAAAHWLATGLPLVAAAPMLGLFLNVPPEAMGAVVLTLAAGTPALSLIGAVGAALAVSLRRGGLLMAILVLPLTIPVLIFGVAATTSAIVGPLPFGQPFTILVGLSLMSVVLGPIAAAAALRLGLE
ncbi:heme exporter protein CcmB [Phreatobacter sp. HK31-P]